MSKMRSSLCPVRPQAMMDGSTFGLQMAEVGLSTTRPCSRMIHQWCKAIGRGQWHHHRAVCSERSRARSHFLICRRSPRCRCRCRRRRWHARLGTLPRRSCQRASEGGELGWYSLTPGWQAYVLCIRRGLGMAVPRHSLQLQSAVAHLHRSQLMQSQLPSELRQEMRDIS